MKSTHCARLGFLALAVACSLRPMAAQDRKQVDRPIVPAGAAGVSSIDAIVKASYEVISGGVGVPRDWGRDRTLFDPDSRSLGVAVDPKTGAVTAKSMTEQEFADRSDSWMVKSGFTEREIKHVIK